MSKELPRVLNINIGDTDVVGDGLYEDIIDALRYAIQRDYGVELHESQFMLGDINISAEIVNEPELDQ